MAESIVRLRVESQEFESKLKRASQELLAMADNARRTGATFAIADKEELDFVRSLGSLQTSARSAKGSIAEMTKAFQDLSVHYRSLTEEEKAAPYGQELKKSLEQLRRRINDGKQALSEINGQIGENKSQTDILAGAVNELAGKFGISVPKIGAMSLAVGGTTAALKVAKDAFFASEANLDEWGRVVESAQSVYQGFLTSLNTGDISGFLSRIDEIISAARQAYDELDRLSTQKAIDSPRLNAQLTENERLRAMLRTGRYIAPNDGRNASMKEGTVLSQEQLTRISTMLQNGMRTSNSIINEQIKQTRTAIDSLYKKEAVNLGMSEKEFRKGTSSMTELDKRMEGYENYKRVQNEIYIARRRVSTASAEGLKIDQKTYETSQMHNPYEQYKAWGVFKDDGQTYTQIVNLIKEMTSLQTQNYNNTAQIYRSINRVDGVTVGGSRGGATASGSTGGTSSNAFDTSKLTFKNIQNFDGGMLQDAIDGKVADKISVVLTDVIKEDLKTLDPEKLKSMLQGTETVNDVFSRVRVDKPDDSGNKKADKDKQQKPLENISKGIGAISNITGALQNMGLKVPDELNQMISVMQGLCTIIQSVQTIISLFSTTTATAQLIATNTNSLALGLLTEAVWANVATNLIPFANGGIVPAFANGGIVNNDNRQHFAYGGIVHKAANGFIGGNHYSGDLVPIAVNSGELILNRAQQGNLASQLSDTGISGMTLKTKVRSKDIEFILNRDAHDTSRGKFLTSKRNG